MASAEAPKNTTYDGFPVSERMLIAKAALSRHYLANKVHDSAINSFFFAARSARNYQDADEGSTLAWDASGLGRR